MGKSQLKTREKFIGDAIRNYEECICFRTCGPNEVKPRFKMQSSSRIPPLVADEKGSVSPEMEANKHKEETPRKVSLTDQGKAAKMLRKRLAFALATNAKMKSDSGTSASEASDQETAMKESKVRAERKSSIPRKLSKENTKKSPQAKQLVGAISERIKTSGTSERRRKLATALLANGAGNNEHKENSTVDFQKQKKTTQIPGFVGNINKVVSNNNIAERMSREHAKRDELLTTIHEQAARNSEDTFGSPNRYPNQHSLDIVENELFKLKMDTDNTLKDFLGINKATERVKMKLEELRKERISVCGTTQAC